MTGVEREQSMRRPIRRVSTLLLVMFLGLFGSSTMIQAVQADSLHADPRNTRTLYDSFAVERGSIVVDGVQVALSTPSNDEFEWQREYPMGPLYAPVTGYNTLGQGNTGIEGAMNAELTGSANSQFLDQILATLTGQDPAGSSVELTIDHDAQQAAADALGGREGAVVALDPETGDVLAMYSSPTFDPNAFASHNTAAVTETYNQLLADPEQPLQNRAIAGDLYYPGSVFKLVTVAAALESGRFDLQSEFDNPETLTLPQSTSEVRNASRETCGPGEQATLETSLVLSCNIPIAQLGQELGQDALAEQAAAFGYGQPLDIPLAVTPSSYPTGLDEAQTMLTAFGQYDVRVTPLQVAMTTAAIANDGTMMRPNMVDRVLAPNLDVLDDPEPTIQGNPISAETAAALRGAMELGVSEGLASNAAIPGVTVGGKTGTAETGENNEPFNLWFTGYGETDDRSVAVAVVVVPDENIVGDTSNVIAAPIGRAVIEAVLNS
ncbi:MULTISPECIES: penicillin-binding transpeptidase domain-containing protein [unclassified Agrococcus]|uniref:peptidoglycan D,D-transpeptidase FtsI family protein n=1 Tax=unclassified Agrococcus TaxID=2615065 RepID=UPI00285C5BEC|nr:penicillin-binding transpeptidase domain-containing protein [Agrococcus sp. BE272]MDR7233831.1 peptidoglycan glycosyltransferase [Agrococcus sp. BE272]